ncbi:MAG TPA: hypothetical protein VH394_29440 [Thermoanaerobaculia bacterium]|nr:hypothetical protein [Thermoanaerobaculia bacterium]
MSEPNEDRSEAPMEIQTELEQLHTQCLSLLMKSQKSDTPADGTFRQHLWNAAQELDLLLDELHIPQGLDLEKGHDPAMAQILYDFVVWRYFMPHPTDDPGDILATGFTPEESNLGVFYQFGRWFATWNRLDEETDRAEVKAQVLLVITREKDGGIVFNEV